MRHPAILITAAVSLLAASAMTGFAADSDPGYGAYAPRLIVPPTGRLPVIYKPTQRYYGKGYTVSYRFIPVTSRSQRNGTTFETQQAHLSAEQLSRWSGQGQPRLTYYNKTSSAAPYTKPGALRLPSSSIAGEPMQPNLPPVGEAPATAPK